MSSPSPVEREIDALYAQPPGDFVAARNALATRLKKAGDGEASVRVKALGRPPVSAWALNQVYWHERPDYDRLLAAGDALRGRQQDVLAGRAGDLREAMRARQDAARTVVDHAMRFLRDAGNAATDATRQRVAVTVDTLAAYGTEPRGYVHGRLDRDLDPPGFEALGFLSGVAAAGPAGGGPSPTQAAAPAPATKGANLRLVQGGAGRAATPREDPAAARARTKAERVEQERADRERRDRERHQRAAIAAAEREIATAERAVARAVGAERDAAAAEHAQARETEALRRQLAKAEERLEAAAASLHEARATRERAETTLAEARRRLAAAQSS